MSLQELQGTSVLTIINWLAVVQVQPVVELTTTPSATTIGSLVSSFHNLLAKRAHRHMRESIWPLVPPGESNETPGLSKPGVEKPPVQNLPRITNCSITDTCVWVKWLRSPTSPRLSSSRAVCYNRSHTNQTLKEGERSCGTKFLSR